MRKGETNMGSQQFPFMRNENKKRNEKWNDEIVGEKRPSHGWLCPSRLQGVWHTPQQPGDRSSVLKVASTLCNEMPRLEFHEKCSSVKYSSSPSSFSWPIWKSVSRYFSCESAFVELCIDFWLLWFGMNTCVQCNPGESALLWHN